MTRLAVVDRLKCASKKCGGFLCKKSCPGVKMGEETIVEDGLFPRIDEKLCTGCGICVKKCPFRAIKVINLPAERGQPVFQYAPNSFRLYGFMLPKENSVVGVIGVNGIGKTTALNLVSGRAKPNFGEFNSDVSWKLILEAFRGQELQRYLESLAEKGVSFSFKAQHVDKLSEFNGTAREMLSSVASSQSSFKKAASSFSIEGILDKKVSELSGGELQKLAIACACSRDADVYCFDEPSSYLDVSERLKVAQRIRELAKEKKVIVIEHDLALLDYLSDYVHVLFGEKGVYGVVSHLKSTKNGINEFLAGYLKDENVRFRERAIRFDISPPQNARAQPVLSYGALGKKYPKFSLSIEAGTIEKSEVVGVMGPNATGKSTFARMIACEEQPSSGELGVSFSRKKISFKPQYVKAEPFSVREHFDSIPSASLDKEIFDSELVPRMDLRDLFDKEMAHLSGGELQRVAIAHCLCKKADIYVLDEPSAFLDVEQRLEAADVIRRVTKLRERNSLVIDHDLVFLDSISDRVILFSGIPGVEGRAGAPMQLREGMNLFLKGFQITFRRDPNSGRPRANKPGSQKDEEQKASGQYYYSE